MRPFPARAVGLKGLAAVAGLALGLAGWAALVPLSGAVVAPGRVEVDVNRQVVQHLDGGIVERLAVRDGDRVTRGQVLMVLDGAALEAQAAQVQAQLDALHARQVRLRAERDGATSMTVPPDLERQAEGRPALAALLAGEGRLFRARETSVAEEQAQLAAQVDQISHQVAGIDAQIAATDRQIALIGKDAGTQRALLSRGLAQAARVMALDRQQAALEGTRGALIATRAATLSQATAARIAGLRLVSTRRETAEGDLRTLDPQALDAAERLSALRARIARLTLRAPMAGIVYDLRISGPQAVIQPAAPILSIVPQDRPLIVAAQVPPVNIDDVAPGAEVGLHLLGFHDRLARQSRGHVLTVSPDAFRDSQTGRAYYEVRIALDRGSGPGGRPILPGMPVEAFIRTGARTPFAYLVAPLRDYFNHALHEG